MNTRPQDAVVPLGYEAAHQEWLGQNPEQFRKRYSIGAPREFYSTTYWKLVRDATLQRDDLTCCRCRKPADQVHHLHYDFMGEDHLHPESLVSICRGCHGVVEHGRNAEALVPVIRRRIYSCTGFVDGRKGFEDQTPVKVFSRLLEYRAKLFELQRMFEDRTPHCNRLIRTGSAEEKAFLEQLQQRDDDYRRLAEMEINSWSGSEREKAARIIPLLELEIQNCRKFAATVFQPVPATEDYPGRSRQLDAAIEFEAGSPVVEALVVGIKFHRGHTADIASGDRVTLMREPDNAYDPNAIKVNLKSGETLGYLAKEFAGVLAKQMSTGSAIEVQIAKVVRDKVYVSVSRPEH